MKKEQREEIENICEMIRVGAIPGADGVGRICALVATIEAELLVTFDDDHPALRLDRLGGLGGCTRGVVPLCPIHVSCDERLTK